MKRTLHARAATEESWLAVLRDGDGEAAWDVFLDGHRRLMLATVRHYVRDYDDVMDVFARVCEGLRADRFARLRRYADKPPDSHTARFSTWLVAVLRNLIMDWFRVRDGRKQLSNAARALPPFKPPLRPSATAAGSFPASGSNGSASPVASSTICRASAFGSRGRLRERSGMSRV